MLPVIKEISSSARHSTNFISLTIESKGSCWINVFIKLPEKLTISESGLASRSLSFLMSDSMLSRIANLQAFEKQKRFKNYQGK